MTSKFRPRGLETTSTLEILYKKQDIRDYYEDMNDWGAVTT